MPFFVLAAVNVCSSPLQAAVLDYQIRRLIVLKTNCQIVNLARAKTKQGSLSFQAKCENVSFYPDGVEIICNDPDLETSCKVLTKEKRFDQLNLLRRSVDDQYKGHDTETQN